MQVNVSNLKQNLTLLNQSLENYKNDCTNLYNELNGTEAFWMDGHSERFFKDVQINKVKLETMQEEFKDLSEVYTYFVNKYEKIGNKIFFDLNRRNQCMQKIDTFARNLQIVIRSYQALDLSFCYEERSMIENEKQKFIKDLKYLNEVKQQLRSVLNEIEEIESNIKLKLNRINVEVLKQNNVNDYLGDNNG